MLKHIKVQQGDIEQGFAEADVIIEREYHTPTTEHAFLEPECAIGVPAGFSDHEKLTVYVGSQIPYQDRNQIARAMGLEEDQVRVIGTLIGGGFGGKEDIAGQIHVSMLATVTGRPVKMLGHGTSGQNALHPAGITDLPSQAPCHHHPHQDRCQARWAVDGG